MGKVCCIFNSAPHYREPIYRLMDRELDCDFYFGDVHADTIKQFNSESLDGFRKHLPIKQIPKTGFNWQRGVWRKAFSSYSHYIITGTPGSLSNWALVLMARLQGKKVLAWTHGMKGSNTRFGTFVEKNFYRICNTILLYGEYSKKVMIQEGFNPKKLVPIYNSLDLEAQLKVRKTLQTKDIFKEYFGNSLPVLIYVGRLQRNKRLDLLVEAVAKLKEQGELYNLVLVGPETDDSEIPEQVAQLGLEQETWFYGPSYEEETIGNLLYNADLLVSPGPIGLTALHAATYGIPIVTNDNLGRQMPEFEVIIPGQTGDFFMEENVADLCEKIKIWAQIDSERRNTIRKIALDHIESRYNPKTQLATIQSLINN